MTVDPKAILETPIVPVPRPPAPEFAPFPKIPRLNREIVVTEKIDGTNAAVVITDDGHVYAQSRKTFITPGKRTDNFGFAAFVQERAADLRASLGPGTHFGEWYGSGIQRGYGLEDGERYFALFNVYRWSYLLADPPPLTPLPDHVVTVPVLIQQPRLDTTDVRMVLENLRLDGSRASGARGFDRPEGVVVWHKQGNVGFKVTLEGDELPKGAKIGSSA